MTFFINIYEMYLVQNMWYINYIIFILFSSIETKNYIFYK